jgi:hypothetical protein
MRTIGIENQNRQDHPWQSSFEVRCWVNEFGYVVALDVGVVERMML